MLEIKNITKKYETAGFKQTALDKVSINFRKNEFTSILGPSGSGKTTLLNIIGGLDHYDSGDLIINEVSTKKYKDRDWDSYRNHRVGFVFQSYNLITHQSVLSNVELALTLSGISKKERRKRALEALDKVGLSKHINKKPNELSGGQMQRVAIARALVNDPEILLADEPTGALDSETSIEIMNILKEISKDKLVIMVTHNPELAEAYSSRIVRLKDGKITSDSRPYDGTEDTSLNTREEIKNTKKTSMNLKTALSLSLNNLMTKKGRTILTAFAGSIGIIGIALILSLSNGIQNYIDKTEKETLSSYPLTIEKENIDMSTLLTSFMGKSSTNEYKDNKVHSVNVMGDVLSTMSKEVKRNDLESLKKYLDNNTKINNYVTDIVYSYDVNLNLYKNDLDNIIRVNPTTVLDSIGMNTSGISNVYSTYMSNYDVFTELIDNEELLKSQYDLVSGTWPSNYNEVVLSVDKNNQISDYTLYSLGILSQDELKEKFTSMINGNEVSFEEHSYSTDELLDISFRLVTNTDYYTKSGNIWINKSEDIEYMKKVIKEAPEIKIVGIIKPNKEAISGTTKTGVVLYTHSLVEYIIDRINNSDIAKEQLSNKEINIFTGTEFSNEKFDINNLSTEQKMYMNNLSGEELAELISNYTNHSTSTYESNLELLGITSIDSPSSINIYPKDFDSKEEIENILEEYNLDKEEDEKITYTDVVGIMMSSVSTIVDVISTVLIVFVAISLVVSSIMIAIITYISVLERTKEIGILRAIGASKKDVRRVFTAETLIEGLVAGIMGILITLLLNIPINIIIKNYINISGISTLPISGAIILIIISVVLTVIAGSIPSKMASSKDPVIALRSE